MVVANEETPLLVQNSSTRAMLFINDTISSIGYGKYQKQLFILCGLGWLADNMWIQVLAVSLPSIQQEFQLSKSVSGIATTATMAGMFLGSFVWGGLADNYGRKIPFFYTLLVSAIFGTLAGFMMDIYSLCICFFIMGLGVGGSLPTDGSLFLEFIPKKRANMLVLMSMFWPAGQVLTSVFGWFFISSDQAITEPAIRVGWRSVVFAVGATTFFMFFLRFFVFKMIESPKYLFKHGDRRASYKSLKDLAKYNDEVLDFTIEDMPRTQQITSATTTTNDDLVVLHKSSFRDRVKPLFSRQLRSTTILIWLIWMLSMIAFSIFYAFLPKFLQDKPAVFNPRLDYVVISLFGIPGSLIAMKTVDSRLGRKGTMLISTLLTAAGLFAFVYFQDPLLLLVCNCFASLFSNIMWGVIYSFTPEAFPTSCRPTGTGIASGIGKSMGIIAPLLSGYLLQIDSTAPMYVSVVLFLVDALCMFLLPIETRDQPMM